jgi:antitoxin (DNA-binding transcriptional repressor) of toxin-antitoxin stability system
MAATNHGFACPIDSGSERCPLVFTDSVLYNLYMSRQMAISEVRKALPTLLKEIQRAGTTVEITNRGVTVARLIGPQNDEAGTARALLSLRQALPRRRVRRGDVSVHKTDYLTRRHD